MLQISSGQLTEDVLPQKLVDTPAIIRLILID